MFFLLKKHHVFLINASSQAYSHRFKAATENAYPVMNKSGYPAN